MYLVGAGILFIHPVGAAGVGAAVVDISHCVAHDGYIADERITEGRPLFPWRDGYSFYG